MGCQDRIFISVDLSGRICNDGCFSRKDSKFACLIGHSIVVKLGRSVRKDRIGTHIAAFFAAEGTGQFRLVCKSVCCKGERRIFLSIHLRLIISCDNDRLLVDHKGSSPEFYPVVALQLFAGCCDHIFTSILSILSGQNIRCSIVTQQTFHIGCEGRVFFAVNLLCCPGSDYHCLRSDLQGSRCRRHIKLIRYIISVLVKNDRCSAYYYRIGAAVDSRNSCFDTGHGIFVSIKGKYSRNESGSAVFFAVIYSFCAVGLKKDRIFLFPVFYDQAAVHLRDLVVFCSRLRIQRIIKCVLGGTGQRLCTGYRIGCAFSFHETVTGNRHTVVGKRISVICLLIRGAGQDDLPRFDHDGSACLGCQIILVFCGHGKDYRSGIRSLRKVRNRYGLFDLFTVDRGHNIRQSRSFGISCGHCRRMSLSVIHASVSGSIKRKPGFRDREDCFQTGYLIIPLHTLSSSLDPVRSGVFSRLSGNGILDRICVK